MLQENDAPILLVGRGSLSADLRSICELEGFSVIQHERGSDAINYLLGIFPRPALVLFDLDSADEPSGVQFVRWKAASALFDEIPLLLVSTRGDLSPEIAEHRASAHLPVPFTRESLVNVLHRGVGAIIPDSSP